MTLTHYLQAALLREITEPAQLGAQLAGEVLARLLLEVGDQGYHLIKVPIAQPSRIDDLAPTPSNQESNPAIRPLRVGSSRS
jgi:hypothetical protein